MCPDMDTYCVQAVRSSNVNGIGPHSKLLLVIRLRMLHSLLSLQIVRQLKPKQNSDFEHQKKKGKRKKKKEKRAQRGTVRDGSKN